MLKHMNQNRSIGSIVIRDHDKSCPVKICKTKHVITTQGFERNSSFYCSSVRYYSVHLYTFSSQLSRQPLRAVLVEIDFFRRSPWICRLVQLLFSMCPSDLAYSATRRMRGRWAADRWAGIRSGARRTAGFGTACRPAPPGRTRTRPSPRSPTPRLFRFLRLITYKFRSRDSHQYHHNN